MQAQAQAPTANEMLADLDATVDSILHGPNIAAPYELSNLPVLEEHVCEQIAGNVPYNIECNLAILRLYLTAAPQFSKVNGEICRKILTKALMALPATHFTECLLLIPTSFAKVDPSVQSLSNLEDILQCCNFRLFWESVLTDPAVSDLVKTPGFCDSMRRYMIEVISMTYQSIALNDLCTLMSVTENSPELNKIIKDHNWAIDDSLGPGKVMLRLPTNASVAASGFPTDTPEGGATGVASAGPTTTGTRGTGTSGASREQVQSEGAVGKDKTDSGRPWTLGRRSIEQWVELERGLRGPKRSE